MGDLLRIAKTARSGRSCGIHTPPRNNAGDEASRALKLEKKQPLFGQQGLPD
jgi:hypothetical protein